MIPVSSLTPESLTALLDDAVVEYDLQGGTDIYVTGLAFNFWLRLDAERPIIILSTYWDFKEDAAELDKLRCVDALNSNLIMIQFFIGSPGNRLSGHYALPIHDALDPRQLLRVARMFAEVFRSAVTSSDHLDIIEPWPDCTSEDQGTVLPTGPLN